MRKGFTMIELIFVIVILGVLASVAIPRLAATRDDAEVAKAATNLTTAVNDLTAYYTAKGSFYSYTKTNSGTYTKGAKISDFTKITNALNKKGELIVKGKIACAEVKLPDDATTASGKVNLTIKFKNANSNDAVCQQLATLQGVKAMCGKTGATDTITPDVSTSAGCQIQIGGSGGINF